MIVEPRVFDDTHVPRELPHRNNELEALADALDPGPTGGGVDNVLIAGPSGVGKTALAKHYLTRAVEHEDVQWTYVQCLGETAGTILRTAARDLTNQDIPGNTPLDDARRELTTTIDNQTYLILDEADDVPETGVLDHLAGTPRLSLLVICHDRERWLSRLSDDHQTRFRTVIQPHRYTVDELADILRPRADKGLEPNVINEGQLRDVADGAAGVARRGIQALRAAAEIAMERGHNKIEDDDVADSFERARRQIREMNLRSLAFHHHVLYELIREAGAEGLKMRELNERYENRAATVYEGQPLTTISRRWRRERMQKLVEYGLVEMEEEGQTRWYRVVDVDIESPIKLSEESQHSMYP